VETQEQIRVRVSLSAIAVSSFTWARSRKAASSHRRQRGWANRLPLTVREQNPTVGNGGRDWARRNGIVDPMAPRAQRAAGRFAAQIDMEHCSGRLRRSEQEQRVATWSTPRGPSPSPS